MPIISRIGSRDRKVRAVYGVIFALLIIGSISMVYPFMMMLSGSVKSDADFADATPYPRFLANDRVLFQKYVESKYNGKVPDAEMARWSSVLAWRRVEPPEKLDEQVLAYFRTWRSQADMPTHWYLLGHAEHGRLLGKNARAFREQMAQRFDDDIAAFEKAMGAYAKTWNMVSPPGDTGPTRRHLIRLTGLHAAYQVFKKTRPAMDRAIVNLDGGFWKAYLSPLYSENIEGYNKAHGTNYTDYHQVFLTRRVPAEGLAREDWEQFVRSEVNPLFVRLDPALAVAYRQHLAEKYTEIDNLNAKYPASYGSFSEIDFSTSLPDHETVQVDWLTLLEDRQRCPAEQIEVVGPRQVFEQYVADQRGQPLEEVVPLAMPIEAADYRDTMAQKSSLRREFIVRNYKQVLDYILLHGRGIFNTIIYCALAILTALLVNPLAAYALSRYKPPSTYTVLLFCMATMAFPAEVTMIPAFLLLKKFPLWPLVGGGIGFGLCIWLISRFAGQIPELLRMAIALGFGVLIGAWFVPTVTGKPFVSLLNTFAALILPVMANGYFIFLLKGFFDSLPRELYEAADLDGASEWTKFWLLTMNLSKPILAVIALQAFMMAYSQFMMALIIIPDQKMWTLMVWLFQLQSQSHQAVIFASLVIAAIPTLLIFVFCQNIIMRGIVVPVEK